MPQAQERRTGTPRNWGLGCVGNALCGFAETSAKRNQVHRLVRKGPPADRGDQDGE